MLFKMAMLVALATFLLDPAQAFLSPKSPCQAACAPRKRADASVNHIVSWRGGAKVNEDQSPISTGQLAMGAQLGLVRVAGYGIIAGSLGLKTPQIARVMRAKSLVGLAPASIYADVFLFATSVIYHVLKRNPIRAYGESVVVLVQTMMMVGLLWMYGGKDVEGEQVGRSPGGGLPGRIAIVTGSIAATAACMRFLPERFWGLLVIVSTPAILAVQLPQIAQNLRQRHTGELAVATVLLSFIGSGIRVCTTIADLGGDPWLLLNYLLGVGLNGIQLVQIWLFRGRTAEIRAKLEHKEKTAAAAA